MFGIRTTTKKYSGIQMIDGKPHTWLQYEGYCPCVKADELKPGMKRGYNGGHYWPIVSVEVGKMVFVSVEDPQDGKIYTEKHRSNSFVPALPPKN